jgi:hypothetical protein
MGVTGYWQSLSCGDREIFERDSVLPEGMKNPRDPRDD